MRNLSFGIYKRRENMRNGKTIMLYNTDFRDFITSGSASGGFYIDDCEHCIKVKHRNKIRGYSRPDKFL